MKKLKIDDVNFTYFKFIDGRNNLLINQGKLNKKNKINRFKFFYFDRLY